MSTGPDAPPGKRVRARFCTYLRPVGRHETPMQTRTALRDEAFEVDRFLHHPTRPSDSPKVSRRHPLHANEEPLVLPTVPGRVATDQNARNWRVGASIGYGVGCFAAG